LGEEECVQGLKSKGERTLGRLDLMLESNIQMDLREIGWDGMDWIHLAQDGNDPQVHKMLGNE
jgi:hypothetical protein